MSVGGVTLLGGVSSSGILASGARAPESPVTLLGQKKEDESPAFVLGGAKEDLTEGLYNSLGPAIMAGRLSGPTQATTPPPDKKRAEALKEAAGKIDGGDTAGGREIAERLLKKNARDVTAINLVAVSHLLERDYKKAERYYAQASGLAPSNSRLKADLAMARTLQKEDEEVLAEARKKLANPTDRDAALRLLSHLSLRSPNDGDVYVAMAEGYRSGRQPARVVGALQEAIRVADGEQIDAVIHEARELVKQHPDVGISHSLLGRALQQAGHLREAIAELRRAVDIAPDNVGYKDALAGGYAARALEKLGRGSTLEAQADLRLARKLSPLKSGLSGVEARIAAKLAERDIAGGRYTAAMSKLATAAGKAPADVAFRTEVADLCARAGSYFQGTGADGQALAAYQQAYRLDPDSALARRRVAELSYSQGVSAMNDKYYDSAIDHLERAYQTQRISTDYGRDLAQAYNLRGELQMSLGNLSDALADFKRGFSIDPSNAFLDANLSAALIEEAAT